MNELPSKEELKSTIILQFGIFIESIKTSFKEFIIFIPLTLLSIKYNIEVSSNLYQQHIFTNLYPPWFIDNYYTSSLTICYFSNVISSIIDPSGIYNHLCFIESSPDAMDIKMKEFKKNSISTNSNFLYGVSPLISRSITNPCSSEVRRLQVKGNWTSNVRDKKAKQYIDASYEKLINT